MIFHSKSREGTLVGVEADIIRFTFTFTSVASRQLRDASVFITSPQKTTKSFQQAGEDLLSSLICTVTDTDFRLFCDDPIPLSPPGRETDELTIE